MTRRHSGPAAVAAGLVLACAPGRPAAPPEAPGAPRVVFSSGRRLEAVEVEVARSDEERERGLMFRERLEPGHGMLFVFDEDSEHVFWMKNTFVSLDMIFIDGLGRVAGVVSRAEPRTTTARTIGAPSRYVLEVPGGWTEEHGIRPGDAVRFEGPVLGPAR